MYPSFSVIFFTTMSGAGYGLLALVGVLAPFGAAPMDWRFGLIALGLALVSITVGLLSSTFHLGHPERAWRAFSQWRSSWLSREGVASVVTYVPAGLFAIAWIFFGAVSAPLGLLAAVGAIGTVICTAMIYRSLRPIPRWHNRWVLPNYLALGLMTGCLWLVAVAKLFAPQPGLGILAVIAIVVAAVFKLAYWRHIDTEKPASTPGTATGLGTIGGAMGEVRLFEAPHTSENYLLKEMAFQVGRKHAARLRRIAILLGLVMPALLSLAALLSSSTGTGVAAALLAALCAMAGTFVERWLFFAEAKHAVTLFYGGSLQP